MLEELIKKRRVPTGSRGVTDPAAAQEDFECEGRELVELAEAARRLTNETDEELNGVRKALVATRCVLPACDMHTRLHSGSLSYFDWRFDSSSSQVQPRSIHRRALVVSWPTKKLAATVNAQSLKPIEPTYGAAALLTVVCFALLEGGGVPKATRFCHLYQIRASQLE